MVARKDDPTIGEFLADVEAKANLKGKTFRNYAGCLRTIASGAFGFDSGASKFDYRGEGNKQWRKRVDSIRLGSLTPDKVQAWKVAFLKPLRVNPAALQSAKRTVSSYIRCARSLFSPKITKFLKVRLPKPLPFEGVEWERAGSMKYNSTIRPNCSLPLPVVNCAPITLIATRRLSLACSAVCAVPKSTAFNGAHSIGTTVRSQSQTRNF